MRVILMAAGLMLGLAATASAQQSAQGGGTLTPGTYVCSASGAGGMYRITVRNASQYVDRAGTVGTYSVAGSRINFMSGSMAGQFSEVLGPGKFGVADKPTRTFYVVCNLT
jgi:hypothetical protein